MAIFRKKEKIILPNFSVGDIPDSKPHPDPHDNVSFYDIYHDQKTKEGQANFKNAIENAAEKNPEYGAILKEAYERGLVLMPKIADGISCKLIRIVTDDSVAVLNQRETRLYEDKRNHNPELEGEKNIFLFRRVFESRKKAFKFALSKGIYRRMASNEENLDSLKNFMIGDVPSVLGRYLGLD